MSSKKNTMRRGCFPNRCFLIWTVISLILLLYLKVSDIRTHPEIGIDIRGSERNENKNKFQNRKEILKLIRTYEEVLNHRREKLPQLLFEHALLEPPSNLPYNLRTNLAYNNYQTFSPSWIFINSCLMDFYAGKIPGFFVEAGAFDGQKLSNTLTLEKELKWTGLLVEGDEHLYQQMRAKNRKSWTSPLCLATKAYSHEVLITSYTPIHNGKGSSRIQKKKPVLELEGPGYPTFSSSLCVPVLYLLEALNITHVDFFSLDVEAVEMEILENFPFDEVTVDVWAIEHSALNNKFRRHSNTTYELLIEDQEFISFMERNGYYLFDIFCQFIADYIFIRINSTLFSNLGIPRHLWKRKGICLEKKLWNPKTMTTDLKYIRDTRHWPILQFQ